MNSHRFGSIEVRRYPLKNGLIVLLAHDPRAEIFAYHSWMRVGSKHEDPSKTGLAHLLEHLMFKATERHPLGFFDREIERRGAESNAATWVDWTYYHETLAHRDDNLRAVIELEADRLTGLVLDDETFASELAVVQNERRMTVDDSVLASLGEEVYRTAFTAHGYRWPTIGYAEHLESMTVDDVRSFYQQHYAPDQTVIVVAGDIDFESTLSLISAAYEHLTPSGYLHPGVSPEPEQESERRVEITRHSQTRYMTLAYRVPGQLDPAAPAVEALTELLFVGDNAQIYHALVTEAQLASDVEGYVTPFAEPGLCEMAITLRPGIKPDAVIDRVDRELRRLPGTLNQEMLEKARNGLELSFLDSLRDADGLAEALGHYEVAHGNFTEAFTGHERARSVTVDAMRDTCERFFRPDNRTIGVVNLP
ncbi:MAG: pitrilysin family protein [Myxococcota bacterium]